MAEFSCLALRTPAERGARHRLCCAHRLQPRLQVAEYLPRFPHPKFSCLTPFFLAPSLENNPPPPCCKGDPREGLRHSRMESRRAGKLSQGSPSPLLQLSYHQNHCKRVLRWRLVATSKVRCFKAKPWLSHSRHQLHGVGGPGGSPELSVNYYFFSLWGDSVCVFISGSANYPFGFP